MKEVYDAAEVAKKRAELSKKLDAAERKLKARNEMLESRIRFGQETGSKALDVKYASDEVKKIARELDRLR